MGKLIEYQDILSMKKSYYGLITAISIVVANMIGTGVFTGLCYQLLGIQDFTAIIALWVIGGLLSLCGAFVYAELGAMFPHSGGEYRYLSDILHPSIGFLSGWVSSTIGFSAPLAMSGITVGNYVRASLGFGDPMVIGISTLIGLSIIHTVSYAASGGFQSLSTIFKVVFICLLIVLGLDSAHWDLSYFIPHSRIDTIQAMTSSPFAVSLVYVIFAYSGWNASAYIASEIKNPEKNLPLSILGGTVLVTALYVLLNMMYLSVAPISELMVDVNTMAPKELVVIAGAKFLPQLFTVISGLIIAFMLISSMSAMVVAGPRVLRSMIDEYSPKKSEFKKGIPRSSIWIQTAIALAMMLTSTYDTLITFTTYLITLFSCLTAIAAIYARFSLKDKIRPFKMFAYPLTPVLFLLINGWILYYITIDKPHDVYVVVGILCSGVLAWIILSLFKKKITHVS